MPIEIRHPIRGRDGIVLARITKIQHRSLLAQQMPQWDKGILLRFIEAEAALVNRQLSLAVSEKTIWTAWRKIGKGVFSDYGRPLVEQKFEDIAALISKL